MRETFKIVRFQQATLTKIDRVNEIVDEYARLGFTLTLRQLFYQFVARQWFANTYREYKNLGGLVTDGRRGGAIDWDAIEDRTRNIRSLPTWDGPAERVASCAGFYHEDIWASQRYRPETWIEKDALTGVIEGACDELRVPWFSCRGNVSDSEMYAAGQRFRRYQGQIPLVLHLGDHDPNGLDMTRDIRERLRMFAGQEIEVRRVALNFDQIDQLDENGVMRRLPPNFAKEKDRRYAAYVRQFGRDCWELDALSPIVISALVRTELESLIDRSAWGEAIVAEDANRALLTAAADNWTMVENALRRAGR